MPQTKEEVSRILKAVRDGEEGAEGRLFSAVYDELRLIARAKMARESPGHTLQSTALVHEAYLRLVDSQDASWENRAHFFGTAAEAMRRILIERARKYRGLKHGGGRQRVPLDENLRAMDAVR